MFDPNKINVESIALDTAFLKRGVPKVIDELAEEAMAEVEQIKQAASDE